nr:unnamed protein product [Callosobruchus analis]
MQQIFGIDPSKALITALKPVEAQHVKLVGKSTTFYYIFRKQMINPQLPIFLSSPRVTSISDNINSIQNEEPSSSRTTSNNFNKTSNVLLSTAVTQVKDNEGRYNQCRALLDNGSQSHFMTEDLSKTLKVGTHKTNMSVSGLNNSVNSVSTYATICIRSNYNSFKTNINCLVVPKITAFPLNKWVSNHPALISHITTDRPESIINIGTDEETHSLGLLCLSKQDYLTFLINFELVDKPSTKRSVLVFDPLGILAPIVVKAKIILQNIWKLYLGWDESLPLSLHTEWQNIYNSLAHINDVRVNRNVLCDISKRIKLHRFADASEKAFGACTYIRSDKVISSWNGIIDAVYLWSDCTVTIGWLRGSPHQWKVNTHDNPADILSRGINPQKIVNCRLRWQGATWLSETDDFWPMPTNELNPIACQKHAKYQRVIALMIRFKFNCTNEQKLTGPLSVKKVNNAQNVLLKLAQSQSFRSEILNIRTKKPIGKAKLLKLNPYLDKDYKHPILLDSKHPFTHLMVSSEHKRLLHAGPQLLLASIREKYWILGGRNLVQRITHNTLASG